MYQLVKKNLKTEKGFSLLELLMVTVVMGILVPLLIKLILDVYAFMGNSSVEGEERNDFSVYTFYLTEDLLFADDIVVKHEDNSETLTYTTNKGKNKVMWIDYNSGLYEIDPYTNEKVFVTKVVAYDETMPLINEIEEGRIYFNIYAPNIGASMITHVETRKNEVYK